MSLTLDEIAAIAGVQVVGDAELRAQAGDVLDRLTTALQSAQDAQERAEVLRAVLEDPDRMAALGALREDGQAWLSATLRARSIRGCASLVRDLERALRQRAADSRGLRLVTSSERDSLPDEVPEGYTVPPGWMVSKGAIYAVEVSETQGEVARLVAHGAIYVTGRLVDADSGTHQLRLGWYGDHGGWVERVVARSTAADARSLVSLSDDGMPVTSGNAADLVKYIAASAATNTRVLPGMMSLGRCGWSDGGFLLGEEWFGDPARRKVLHADGGLGQIAGGLTTGGTWEGWCSTMAEVADLPYPWLAVWGAVASVLLHPLGQRMGFVMDFSGPTSTGKSSVLEAGISVSGPPRGPAFATWKLTISSVEAILYTLHHLPTALDDTKQAERPEHVSDVIYMAANGKGKTRGAPSGKGAPVAMRLTAGWLSGVLSTGEQRATAFTRDEGAAARTISLEGLPFGGEGAEYRKRAVGLTRGLAKHHGHLVRRVVPWVLDGGAELAAEWLAEEVDRYTEPLAALGAVQGRLGETLALVAVASRVCEAVGAPMPVCDPLGEAYMACARAGEAADQARMALDRVYALATARPGAFLSRHSTDEQERDDMPPSGWLGYWSPLSPDWRAVMLYPNVVEDELRRAGFEVAAVTKAWADRGWTESNHGLRYRFKRGGRLVTVYRILRAAVDA